MSLSLLCARACRKVLPTRSLLSRVVPCVAALVLGMSMPGAAQAQQQAEDATVWVGSETLAGFGELAFVFYGGGKAVMIDAVTVKTGKKVTGTWTRAGDNITIRFKDCEYRGEINGTTFSGTGQYFVSPYTQWTFSVTYTGPLSDYKGR